MTHGGQPAVVAFRAAAAAASGAPRARPDARPGGRRPDGRAPLAARAARRKAAGAGQSRQASQPRPVAGERAQVTDESRRGEGRLEEAKPRV